jgi:hypothetical protein
MVGKPGGRGSKVSAATAVWRSYNSSTGARLKAIDCYLLFVAATLIAQLLYVSVSQQQQATPFRL